MPQSGWINDNTTKKNVAKETYDEPKRHSFSKLKRK